MRRFGNIITSIISCSTIAFVVFNRTITEPKYFSNSNAGFSTSKYVKNYSSNLRADLRKDYPQPHRYVTPSLAEFGGRRSIPEMSDNTLMVTRVPGTGSEILILILQRLQGMNAFKHIRLPPGDDNLLTTLQQELLVEDITTIIRQEAVPLTFDADLRFLNFSLFDRQAPTFISMIRHPLDPKILSRYENNIVTSPKYCGSIAYFCGQDPRCVQDNRTWALTKAKTNIERWYPVVGLLEHIETTLKTLERTFPYFFKGATKLYSKLPVKKRTGNFAESKVTNLEKRLLREPLAKEVEFYEWIKLRLLYTNSGNG